MTYARAQVLPLPGPLSSEIQIFSEGGGDVPEKPQGGKMMLPMVFVGLRPFHICVAELAFAALHGRLDASRRLFLR